MKNLLKILWLIEFILALLIIAGVADATMAYISLFVLAVGIWKLNDLDALRFYIYSIPIFVVLPSSALSDSMSVWRVALLVFLLKVLVERFDMVALFKDKNKTLSEKKDVLVSDFRNFIANIKKANYYPVVLAALALAGAGVISLLGAQSLGAGVKKLIFLYSIFLLFGIVWFALRSREDARRLLRAVFVSGSAILAVGYAQFISVFLIRLYDFWWMWNNHIVNAFYGERTRNLLSYSNTWFSYYGDDVPPTLRMFSVMQDSHSFSLLMILFAPLALYYAYTAPKRGTKAKYSAVFALMLLAVWFSGSRGAWVGWLGAFVAALYIFYYDRLPALLRMFKVSTGTMNLELRKKLLVAFLAFLVLFPVSNYLLGASQDAQLRLDGKLGRGESFALVMRTLSISDMDETSNKGRMEIWRDSAHAFLAHPLIGIGLGNFPLALGEKVATAKIGASAHNIYLDVAVEMGIIGLLAFLFLLWKLCLKLFRLGFGLRDEGMRFLSLALFVSFAWILAYGFFDVVIINDKVLMYVVIFLALMYRWESLENGEVAEKA
jgi:O-antigen ligase